MNNELNRDMSVEDSENNNVDENSNDHQYNEYANYHNQYINHQYRRPEITNNFAPLPNNNTGQPSVRPRFESRSGIHQRQDVDEEISLQSVPTINPHHRRSISEDNSFSTSNILPLPNNRLTASQNRRQLLNPSTHHWYSHIHRGRNLPSEEDIRNEGAELLYNFVGDQFQHENINPSDYLPSYRRYSSPSLMQTGRDLRLLADEFGRSQERRELRNKAQRVDMSSISCENFFDLLTELFCRDDRGITRERIIVLFTFICDVAIQQVRQRAERFISQLMEWSLQFIFNYICAWVQQAGGWGVVLSRGANIVFTVAKIALAALGVVALGIFIKKNWHHL